MENKILNFCTLLDSNYLSRCVAMYHSLAKNCKGFNLYVFAMDNSSYSLLKKLGLPSVTVVSRDEFEDKKLLGVKAGRNKAEYYWTCTPSVIKYSIERFNLSECTYIDADLFFFGPPNILLDELADRSILITSHGYGPDSGKALKYGKYCVQFNTFKNNPDGMTALDWWRNRCIEWCFVRLEEGKFGDQKYLDDWTERFSGVHILQHQGGGVAPWNYSRFRFFQKEGRVWIKEVGTGKEFSLIFYHFHRTALYKVFGKVKIKSHYLLVNQNRNLQKLVYKEYEIALSESISTLRKAGFNQKFDSRLEYLHKSLQEIFPSWIKRSLKRLVRHNN